jgi:Fur family ferric uptake transcriptional regulator
MSPLDVFNNYLKENNIRNSEQRNNVLEVFLNTEKHLTVAELYNLVNKKYPEIGYATIYRAMKVICDSGIADELDFGDGVKRFEHKYGHDHHDHLICVECGKYIEVCNPQIEKLQDEMGKKHGFKIYRHKLNIYGVCKECQ